MKISFPRMGAYHTAIAPLLSRLFPNAVIAPAPPITRKTAALGARHSPDFICEPFKYNMGNFIEALDDGATVLVQTGTGCRYGYYGELQEQILRDLGYEFTFLCLSRGRLMPGKFYQRLKDLGSPLSARQMAYAIAVAVESVRAMDKLASFVRENAGFAVDKGEMWRLEQEFLRELPLLGRISDVYNLARQYGRKLRAVPCNYPGNRLKVGIVGDLYTVMEAESNCHVEKQLIQRGIEVARQMSVSFLLFGLPRWWRIREAGKYLRYPVGANGLDSVAQTRRYAMRGYDGVIHLKSFGCTPELNAAPAMAKIGQDYKMPILNMSFDTNLSETGVKTRLDAFMDMIEMRREHENLQLGGGRGLYLNKRRGLG